MDAHESRYTTCPPWCAERHDAEPGEDVVHVGPVTVVGRSPVRLCASDEPDGGEVDGPYLLVGDEEYTVPEARQLAAVISEAADQADRATAAGD